MNTKTWGMLCHLSSFSGWLTGCVGFIAGPLLVWIAKKDEIDEVEHHGKESLNFNLTCLALFVVGIIPSVLTFGFFAVVYYPVLLIFQSIFSVIATIKANEGESYRYPLSIRFVQ